MLQLTPEQTTLLVCAVGAACGLLGWLGRGFAFVLKRWWTAAPDQDRAAYLNSVADLATKLRATGMTLKDVRSFEQIMRNPTITSTEPSAKAVESLATTAEPEAFTSNFAMKARTEASYDVAESRLEQALLELRFLIREDEEEALLQAQEAWNAYRSKLEDRALRQYIGGTHATLAMALAGLAETERRTEELRIEIVERGSQ